MEETLKTLQERTDIMAKRALEAIEALVDYINAITAPFVVGWNLIRKSILCLRL